MSEEGIMRQIRRDSDPISNFIYQKSYGDNYHIAAIGTIGKCV